MNSATTMIGNNPLELGRYFNELGYYLKVSADAKRRLDKKLASSFSVFTYINNDENTISNILANLLNPSGTHGQEALFLKHFLTLLNKDDRDLACDPTVTCEQVTDLITNARRRIDIQLHWGNFGIGIENKPWASESDNQLKDYNEQLSKAYGDNYILVLLCPAGMEAQSIENWEELVAAGKAATLNYYPQLYNWLIDCRQWCEANKVRHFLQDFADYIEEHFKASFLAQENKHV